MLRLRFLGVIVCLALTGGCGGGSGSSGGGGNHGPTNPMFTSTAQTVASEGVLYTYQVTATSADSSAITFTLTAAPAGATLSGNTVTWTPTHAESRISNSFAVTAQTAAGLSATQSWTVTPTGNVNITAVITYWTPSGTSNQTVQWIANAPFPAALIPQTDGTLQRLTGSANADGSLTIPNVPAGYYWLQINPNANYWTSTGDFDYGQDVVGQMPTTAAQSTTIFNVTLSGITPTPTISDYALVQSDSETPLPLAEGTVPAMSPTFTGGGIVSSNVDWSKITTLYAMQYSSGSSGNGFSGFLLGGGAVAPAPAITNGTANNISVALSTNPAQVSIPLSIAGSAWASLAATSAPGNPLPAVSDYAVFAEPFLTDRYAEATLGLQLGPTLTLLRPAVASGLPALPPPYGCATNGSLSTFTRSPSGNPPITWDADYGTISYADPFPATWIRNFQYCQYASVVLPRPNSTGSDTFSVGATQITGIPTGPVTPILTTVQSPTLNGASLFQSATLNTLGVTISWSAPATGQPIGYSVTVYELQSASSSVIPYAIAGTYTTTKTSLTIPFLTANNTYVFSIRAIADAAANLETAPLRHKIPMAQSELISAPMVIAAGATP